MEVRVRDMPDEASVTTDADGTTVIWLQTGRWPTGTLIALNNLLNPAAAGAALDYYAREWLNKY